MNEKFSKIGFILAVAGSAVGLGNAWKFPTLVGQNGGSAYILLYLILTFAVSFVIFLAEIAVGKISEKDPVNAFKTLAPKNKDLWKFGGFFIIGAILIFSFYSVVMGWIFKYLFMSFYYLPSNIEQSKAIFDALLFKDIFSEILYFTLAAIITFYVVSKGIKGGIERLNVWMMPMLFIFLVLMLCYSMSMDGFLKSTEFILKPDFSKVNISSVLSALGLAFFTLSLGVGTIITYASSLPNKTNLVTSSLCIVFINILIGVMMGLVVFTFIFEFGADPSAQGPGLIFVSLTTLFAKLGILGNILAVMFFISLLFAALTSAVSMIEPSVAYMINSFNFSRKKALTYIFIFVYFMGFCCILSFYEATSFTIFKMSFFDILDYLTSNIMMPLSGIVTSIFVGFIMKKRALYELFSPYMNDLVFKIWYMLLRFVAPVAVLIIMLTSIFKS